METQEIVKLLNDYDNQSSKFTTKKWYVVNDQTTQNIVKEMKIIQALNLKQKLLNQIFVII